MLNKHDIEKRLDLRLQYRLSRNTLLTIWGYGGDTLILRH